MLKYATVVRIVREVVITVLIALAIFVPLKTTVQAYEVQYSCMLPNIEDGDWIIVDKAVFHFVDPERGEVIVFQPPDEVQSEYPFIKRVIGMPGETVEVHDDSVFIDGVALDESYIRDVPRYEMAATVIPEAEYFVLGDNRNSANDSHNGWTVPRENVIGKAKLTYWPLQRWTVIRHYD